MCRLTVPPRVGRDPWNGIVMCVLRHCIVLCFVPVLRVCLVCLLLRNEEGSSPVCNNREEGYGPV